MCFTRWYMLRPHEHAIEKERVEGIVTYLTWKKLQRLLASSQTSIKLNIVLAHKKTMIENWHFHENFLPHIFFLSLHAIYVYISVRMILPQRTVKFTMLEILIHKSKRTTILPLKKDLFDIYIITMNCLASSYTTWKFIRIFFYIKLNFIFLPSNLITAHCWSL